MDSETRRKLRERLLRTEADEGLDELTLATDEPYNEELSYGQNAFDSLQRITKGRYGMCLGALVEEIDAILESRDENAKFANCLIMTIDKSGDSMSVDLEYRHFEIE